MRKIFLWVTACLITIAAQAQVRFGPRVGISTNFVSAEVLKYMVKDNTIGFYVGPTAEFRFSDRFGADASVLYSQKSVRFTGSDSHIVGYIQVPLNAKYYFNTQNTVPIFIAAGPYVGFKVSGDDTFAVSTPDLTGQWETRSFNIGGSLAVGAELFELLQLSLVYSMGTSDSFDTGVAIHSTKERQLSFALAVYF